MCLEKISDLLFQKGIKTAVYRESYHNAGKRMREFLPYGKILLLADEKNASLLHGLAENTGGLKTFNVLFSQNDKPESLFSLPDEVRGVIAAGERSIRAARFFCTLRRAYLIAVPTVCSANALFSRFGGAVGGFPVKEPSAVIADESIISGVSDSFMECALSSLCAFDLRTDAVFSQQTEKNVSLFEDCMKLLQNTPDFLGVFACSCIYQIAKDECQPFSCDGFYRQLCKNRSRGVSAAETLAFFADKYKKFFTEAKPRLYFVPDYLSRVLAAEKVGGRQVFDFLKVSSAKESFLRVRLFSECRSRFQRDCDLLSRFVSEIMEKYYLLGGRRENFDVGEKEELYSLSCELSPYLSVVSLAREFGLLRVSNSADTVKSGA